VICEIGTQFPPKTEVLLRLGWPTESYRESYHETHFRQSNQLEIRFFKSEYELADY
jgi:hypothetical protein